MPLREQGYYVLTRVLCVYDLYFVLPAISREYLCRRKGRTREVELKAGHTARCHLLGELAGYVVGEMALVIRCGENAY